MSSPFLQSRLVDRRRPFRATTRWDQHRRARLEKTGEQRVVNKCRAVRTLALSTPTADQLDEVVDYDFIRRRSIGERRGARPAIHLQETLADDLLRAMLAHLRGMPRASPPKSPTSTPDRVRGRRRGVRHRDPL